MEKAKTPTERLREALEGLRAAYGVTADSWFFSEAQAALAELTAETPDQRAERLLGKWLVEDPDLVRAVRITEDWNAGANPSFREIEHVLSVFLDVVGALRKAGSP